jgi:NADH:ubiquinone oxidoreductase subunit 3 (subunit A)
MNALSPPIVMVIFLAIASCIYWLGGQISAQSDNHPGKHEPYACGEDIAPTRVQLSYRTFFHLALMFGILHVTALVLSTLPLDTRSTRIPYIYIGAVVICVFVLMGSH